MRRFEVLLILGSTKFSREFRGEFFQFTMTTCHHIPSLGAASCLSYTRQIRSMPVLLHLRFRANVFCVLMSTAEPAIYVYLFCRVMYVTGFRKI